MEKVMIVDDNEKTRTMLKRHLKKANYEAVEARDGATALLMLARHTPGVVLLDVMMPGMSGMEVCEKIRERHDSDLYYILMLTGVTTRENKVQGLDTGADDYVTKPFDIQEVLARVRVGFRTVTARRLAIIDSLTQLYNKNFCSVYLEKEVAKSLRYKHPLSMVITDIDHFKQVNDTYGHQAGDRVLAEMGSLLKSFCRNSDLPVRWGGEEFLLLLPETDSNGAAVLAEKIRAGVEAHTFPDVPGLTASFGVAQLTDTSADTLLKAADDALYQAKRNGRNQVVVG